MAKNALNNKLVNRLIDDPEQEVTTPSKIAKYHEWSKDTLKVSRRWRNCLVRMTGKWYQQMLEEVMQQKREGNKGREPKQKHKVLIKDERVRRNLWKKGSIEKLLPSHDGKIRNVEVKELSGKIVRRSLKDVIVIE